MSARASIFIGLTVACVAGSSAYVLAAGGAATPAVGGTAAGPATAPARVRPLAAVPPRGLLVLNLDGSRPETLRHVTEVSAKGARRVAKLACDRMHFSHGRGICIAPGRGSFGSLYSAKLFDASFTITGEIPLGGAPTRARVSPDGLRAAATMFVTGHSYSEPGKFSTQTVLIDMKRGGVVADLEKFTITHGGELVDAPDVNFWGVTFARDSNRFYATMATGGKTYLIEGDVAARTARTLRENVECPSLSPDGTRIAFKKFVGLDRNRRRTWNLRVLDLRTMKETVLAERASIDDQAAWSGGQLVYGNGAAVWTVPSDGTGTPVKLVAGAHSPAPVG